MENIIYVIIYARYSSDNQRYESITAQIRACKEYAEKRGYTVVAIYIDEAKTATTDHRPEFLRMMDDIKSSAIEADVLLVHKLDRFARNRYDSAFYRHELGLHGVKIESVTENLDGSPESALLESLLEGLNEYYSKNLAREVMKGMKESALQAKHTGGVLYCSQGLRHTEAKNKLNYEYGKKKSLYSRIQSQSRT